MTLPPSAEKPYRLLLREVERWQKMAPGYGASEVIHRAVEFVAAVEGSKPSRSRKRRGGAK